MTKDNSLTSGPIVRNLLLLALPLIASNILQLLYDTADLIVLGNFAGKEAIASVGATGSAYHLIINVFLGLSTGTGVLVAQYYGGDKRQEMSDTVHTSATVSLIVGIFVGTLGFFLAPALMQVMNTPADIIDGAVLYLRILFLGMPALTVFNFGAAILRSVGDSRRPVLYLIISGALNVGLNLIFVIVFKLDIAGVAIATIISQYLSAALVWLALMRTHQYYSFDIRRMRINKKILMGMIKIGVPSGLQMAMYSLANMFIQASINSFGTDFVAASTASNKIENIVYGTMTATSQASMVFAGQNMGAGKLDRIKKLFFRSNAVMVVMSLALSGMVLLFASPLLGFLAPDPDVISLGIIRLMIVCPLYFLCGIYENALAIIRGMGKSFVPMLGSAFGICIVRTLWIYTVVTRLHTFETLLLVYPVSWGITAIIEIIMFFVFFRGEKKKAAENASALAEDTPDIIGS